ncbi:cupin domain-containing protein [Oceanobacillus damuensis]|uniref:cupin domain-containing protein n=1 Tax=Oceanobacillus damuensis TaxID=937928 RepID=UPI000AC8EDD0|nr:cupin domain-containing protein [Oceanobacillus damuensis]
MKGMRNVYYSPNMYSSSYYGNTPAYHPQFMARNIQGNEQQVLEAVLSAIIGKATIMDLYSRLADVAPNRQDKEEILNALENRKIHLKKFTDLYVSRTGIQPVYEIDKVNFDTYREGLQKAYDAIVEDYEKYRNSYVLTRHSPARDIFFQVCKNEVAHAERFSSLASNEQGRIELKDYGSQPFIVDIEEATKQNNTFRTALWTGSHLQVTVMSINAGEDIGLEVHPSVDQFLRIEQGEGLVQMGNREDDLDFQVNVYDDYAIMVPAGKWHNLTNTGNKPLKLYTIYAPPEHPFGTVHRTKAEAMAAE